ncbi:ankyrin repeat domain-containing protein [Paenibacillus psychroresistens]|uniref:Ankyrin repeat domain-containing protein n=1 Tax=Paenibacillus psychroresistens TaxID=1778678 RepID=A0A6B8RSN6_9BACL|nr:ankyrin repeat domain-containing protein [Paenibacillus psychroresistens]QGQ98939.1 ankyrin repeat domain-containing protein [Paenibacillus psychroresistens]
MERIVDDSSRDARFSSTFPIAVRSVKTGDVETLERLLQEQPELATVSSLQGRTLLHHLCDFPGHYPRAIETGSALIASGADVHARAINSVHGESGLQWAASNDDSNLVNLLIDAGAAVNGLNDDLRPLAQALWYGFPQVAETLVKRGATINLEFAAGLGRIDLLSAFLDTNRVLLQGAGKHTPPINAAVLAAGQSDELIEQALTYAVIAGNIEGVKYLLDCGADINAQPSGFDGQATPLHRAVARGNGEMVRFLISHGANMEIADRIYGSTALGWAEHLELPSMIELLRSI